MCEKVNVCRSIMHTFACVLEALEWIPLKRLAMCMYRYEPEKKANQDGSLGEGTYFLYKNLFLFCTNLEWHEPHLANHLAAVIGPSESSE